MPHPPPLDTSHSTVEGNGSENGARRSVLTPRETEVVLGFCNDLTYKEIAARLGISPKTVEFHAVAIRAKLRVKGIAGIIRYAIRTGLIPP